MATERLLVVVLLAAAVCISVDGHELLYNSTTTVKDGKDQVLAISNMTSRYSSSNRTTDSAMLNNFVQKQFNRLQKNPELFAVSDTFGHVPHQPPRGLVLSYVLSERTKIINPISYTTVEISLKYELYTKKNTDREALRAFRAPTF